MAAIRGEARGLELEHKGCSVQQSHQHSEMAIKLKKILPIYDNALITL